MLKYKKYLIVGLIFAIFNIVYTKVFDKQLDAITFSVILGVVIFIISYFDMKRIKKDFQEMRGQINAYNVTGNADEFIKREFELIERVDSNSLQNMIKLNIIAAYADKKEFDKARTLLDEVEIGKFDKVNRPQAAINKSYLYYRIGDFDEGDRIFDEYLPNKPKRGGVFYDIVYILRNQRDKEGIKDLSELNMKKENEAFRALIASAKEIIFNYIQV